MRLRLAAPDFRASRGLSFKRGFAHCRRDVPQSRQNRASGGPQPDAGASRTLSRTDDATRDGRSPLLQAGPLLAGRAS